MIYKDKALAIVAAVMLLGCLFLLSAKLNSLDIQKNGKLVTVRIIDVPRSCEESSGRNNAYFRFEYFGKIHIKDLITSQCDYVLDHKTILLKTDNESSDFLFKDEDVSSEIGAMILIMLFLIFCVFRGLRKEKLTINLLRKGNYIKEKKPRQPKTGRYGNKI